MENNEGGVRTASESGERMEDCRSGEETGRVAQADNRKCLEQEMKIQSPAHKSQTSP